MIQKNGERYFGDKVQRHPQIKTNESGDRCAAVAKWMKKKGGEENGDRMS